MTESGPIIPITRATIYDFEITMIQDEIKREAIADAARAKAVRKKPITERYDRATVERACRMYKSSVAAAQVLDMSTVTLKGLCEAWDIESPAARKRREREEAKRDDDQNE